MEFDVCLPNNNEEEFLQIAQKLGIAKLIFLYPFKDKKDFENKKNKAQKLRCEAGLIVDDSNFKKTQGLTPYLFAKNPSRDIIEFEQIKYLYAFEISDKKDFMHHKNSGLNQVLLKIIKEKDKTLCFSINELIKSKQPQTVMGRMMQNARFAKKYEVNTTVLSFATTPFELRATKEKQTITQLIRS